MKLLRHLILWGLLGSAVFLAGCSKDPGTPPEVVIAGVPVVVGESTPSSLREAGFTTSDLGRMILELPDRSWTSSVYLKKDDISYASLTLVNDSKEERLVGLCVIEELGFYALDDENRALDITINGVNPIGKTVEELKELYPELELDDDDGDYLWHYLRNGDYSVSFQYSKGVLTDIDVSHTFNKSYQSK